MRVFIWQQFSSNHSADFMVVGRFTTAEEAARRGEELREVIRKMAAWYDDPANQAQIKEVYKSFQEDEGNRLHTTPEIELNDKYDVGFSFVPLDWLGNSAEVGNAVKIFDKVVVLDPTSLGIEYRTWVGQEPFDRVLGKMGATVYVDESMEGNRFWIRVTCTAPSIEAAEELRRECELRKEEWRVYDLHKNSFRHLPWMLSEFWAIHREDAKLTIEIEDVNDFPDDLAKLLTFLKERGFDDIAYELVEGHPDND